MEQFHTDMDVGTEAWSLDLTACSWYACPFPYLSPLVNASVPMEFSDAQLI